MNMKNLGKRLLALLLTVTMVLGMIPSSVLAESADGSQESNNSSTLNNLKTFFMGVDAKNISVKTEENVFTNWMRNALIDFAPWGAVDTPAKPDSKYAGNGPIFAPDAQEVSERYGKKASSVVENLGYNSQSEFPEWVWSQMPQTLSKFAVPDRNNQLKVDKGYNPNIWPLASVTRFQTSFVLPNDYDKTKDSYTLKSANPANAAKNQITLNDDVFLFISSKDDELTNDNFIDHMAFWSGTVGEDPQDPYMFRTVTFHGVRNTPIKYEGGKIDYVAKADFAKVDQIIKENNYKAGDTVYIDLILDNWYAGTLVDNFTLVHTRAEEAPVLKAKDDAFSVVKDRDGSVLNVLDNDVAYYTNETEGVNNPELKKTTIISNVSTNTNDADGFTVDKLANGKWNVVDKAQNIIGLLEKDSSNTNLIFSPIDGFTGKFSFAYDISIPGKNVTSQAVVKVNVNEGLSVTFDATEGGKLIGIDPNPGKTLEYNGFKFNDAFTKPIPKAEKEGHAFVGFAKANDPNQTIIKVEDFPKIVTESAVYVAVYKVTKPVNATYKIEQYYQQENGNYNSTADKVLTKPELTGEVGKDATVQPADYPPEALNGLNYAYDKDAQNLLSGKIQANGELTLKLYYKLQYEVSFNQGDYGSINKAVDGVLIIKDLDKSSDINSKKPTPKAEEGYDFVGWKDGVGNDYAPEVELPKLEGDTTYTAVYKKDATKWATLTFNKGSNGTIAVDGKTQDTFTLEVLKGTKWENIPFTVPEITPNSDYQKADANWSWNIEQPKIVNENLNFTALYKTNPDLWISKTVDKAGARIGEEITYTINVLNHGQAAAKNEKIVDAFPIDKLELVGVYQEEIEQNGEATLKAIKHQLDGSTLTWVAENINGKTENNKYTDDFINVYKVKAKIKSEGVNNSDVIKNAAIIASNNQSSEITTLVGEPNLSIKKEAITPHASNGAVYGDIIQYTITVENTSPTEAKGITLKDTLIKGLEFQYAENENNEEGTVEAEKDGRHTITFKDQTIPGGTLQNPGTVVYTIVVKIESEIELASGESIKNTAEVKGDGLDVSSNLCEVIYLEPNMSITKKAKDLTGKIIAEVRQGQEFDYEITVNNDGMIDLESIEIIDVLPEGLKIISVGDIPNINVNEESNQIGWRVEKLNIKQSKTYKIRVQVIDDKALNVDGKIIENNVYATTSLGQNFMDSESKCIVTVKEPNLSVQKTAMVNDQAVTSVRNGDTVKYIITVNNTGSGTARDVTITDTLPKGLKDINILKDENTSAIEGIYNDKEGTVTWKGNIRSGIHHFVITAVVEDSVQDTQTLTNNVKIAGDIYKEGDPSQPQTSTSVTINKPKIEITKTAQAVARAGDTVEYTLKVKNTGSGAAKDLLVADVLPEGLTFVSADNNGSLNPEEKQTVMWKVESLAPNAEMVLKLQVRVNKDIVDNTPIINTARVEEAINPNGGVESNEHNLMVKTPNLSITKEASNKIPRKGEAITYTLKVRNDGEGIANNLVVTDILPNNMRFTGVEGQANNVVQDSENPQKIIWTVGNLEKEEQTLSIKVVIGDVADDTLLQNIAYLSGDRYPATTEDQPKAEENVVVKTPNLAVEKTVDNPSPRKNESIQYTIKVSNTGGADATGLIVTDSLPENYEQYMTIDKIEGHEKAEAKQNGHEITWENQTVKAGATNTYVVTATIKDTTPDNTILKNKVIITGDKLEEPKTDEREVLVNSPAVKITKAADRQATKHGDTIKYTLTLSNYGAGEAKNLKATDTLGEGLSFVRYEGAGSLSHENGILTWNVDNLLGGSEEEPTTKSVDVYAKVSETPSITTVRNSVVLNGDQLPGNPENQPKAEVELPVYKPEISVLKVADKTEAKVGETVHYTITVENKGQISAENLTVKDTMPAGMEGITAEGATLVGQDIIWTGLNLEAGQSLTLKVSGTLAQNLPVGTELINTVVVNGSTILEDQKPQAEAKVTITEVPKDAAISITKQADLKEAKPGDTITYTISVKNNGTEVEKNLTITDDVPTTLRDIKAEGATINGNKVVWNIPEIAAGQSLSFTVSGKIVGATAIDSVIKNTAIITGDRLPGEGLPGISEDVVVKKEPVKEPAKMTFIAGENGYIDGYGKNISVVAGSDGTLDGLAASIGKQGALGNGGFKFVGWALTDDATNKIVHPNAIPTKIDKDVSYTAQYEVVLYNVTFKQGNDGQLISSPNNSDNREVNYTSEIKFVDIVYNREFPTIPGVAPNAGYELKGWFIEGTADIISNQEFPARVQKDATYTAVYQKTASTTYGLNIHYIFEDGSQAAPSIQKKGLKTDDTFSIASPIIDNYEPSLGIVEGTVGKASIEVTITYTKTKVITHTVTFKPGDGGSFASGNTVEILGNIVPGSTMPSVPSVVPKNNSTFDGWTIEGGASDVVITPEEMANMVVNKDITYVAHYQEPIPNPTYTITFLPGDNGSFTSSPNADNASYSGLSKGALLPTAPAITEKDGYVFIGWANQNTPDVIVKPEALKGLTVSDNSTYVAKYQKISTITFDRGNHGGFADSRDATIVMPGILNGTAFPEAPAIAPDAGYEFIGWTPSLPNTVEGSQIYVAQYRLIMSPVEPAPSPENPTPTPSPENPTPTTAPENPTPSPENPTPTTAPGNPTPSPENPTPTAAPGNPTPGTPIVPAGDALTPDGTGATTVAITPVIIPQVVANLIPEAVQNIVNIVNPNLVFDNNGQAIEEINANETPLANKDRVQCWIHWLMLLITIVYVIYAVLRLIIRKRKNDALEDELSEMKETFEENFGIEYEVFLERLQAEDGNKTIPEVLAILLAEKAAEGGSHE